MNWNKTMRTLHRDLGFFVLGLMLVYSLSGTVLLFRSSDFLKQEKRIERTIEPNMQGEQLGKMLHLRDFKVMKEDAKTLTFSNNGIYDKVSGKVAYTDKEYIFPLNKMASLHMLSSKTPIVAFGIIGGLSLFLLALTSFWMYRPGTKQFRSGMIWVGAGIVMTVILLFFV